MEVKYLKENITLTELTKFLNESERFKKNSGKPFKTHDVSQYIKTGHLPVYMGGSIIDKSNVTKSVKLYNLLENEG
jgi:hypothetical protein